MSVSSANRRDTAHERETSFRDTKRAEKKRQATWKDLLSVKNPFYQTESAYLARLAARVGVPPVEIADMVQRVWLKAVIHCDTFGGTNVEGQLRCWLRTTLWKEVKDFYRRRARLHFESLDSGNGTCDEVDETARPDTVAEDKELVNWLLEQARAANVENYHLLYEHYLQGLSSKEIASRRGLSEKAVESRMGRMRKLLRERAEAEFGGGFEA